MIPRMSSHSFTCLVRDIPGAEGPCVDLQGRIFMVGPNQGRILQVLPDGSTRDVAKYDGIPAGLQLDRNGDIWCADMKRGITKVTLDGKLTYEVTEFEGQPIRGCNDCIFDTQGNLYFTAPAGSGEGKPFGELFCRLTSGEVKRLDIGYQFCNGLAVNADDSVLVIAETFSKKLWAFDIVSPGVVTNKRVFATLPDAGSKVGGDGMDFDEQGNLLATHWGGGVIEIYDPNGRHIGVIKPPVGKTSNVHFMGPGSGDILITEHETNGLWKTTHFCAGQRQYGWK